MIKRLTLYAILIASMCAGNSFPTFAQQKVLLSDLTAFKDPGKTWSMAGEVTADLNQNNVFTLTKGNGILVNLPDKKNKGVDLYTKEEYGDIDLELEYMMAKGSNSGIYLQGRYELQLEDTWGSKTTASGKNGGIYEQWDDSRPEGAKGFGGFAPRQNASRAPGLWQQLKISFQAPRFDSGGKKIQSAKMLRVELNGVLIHENVELPGPTRGSMNPEKVTGPLRIQGDHGAVAFRNISITAFDQPRQLSDQTSQAYRVYPIVVEASAIPVFRSFMDLPNSIRVVHAVSVASDEKVHYTYDTDTGMILQLWRGGFLDATPMWFSRGDGSARPVGAVVRLGAPALALVKLPSPQAEWKSDTTGTGFRPRGYALDNNDEPVFHYRTYGVIVKDATLALADGRGISREISVQNPVSNLYFKLAEGTSIVDLGKGMYMVGDHAYYLQVDVTENKPVVRDAQGGKELIMPIAGKLKYTILF